MTVAVSDTPQPDAPVTYKVLRPGALARIALEEHPDWSNRRLAAAYGISEMTVGRARKSLATNVGCPTFVAPDPRRIGSDGKSYPARGRPPSVAPEIQTETPGRTSGRGSVRAA